jgi:hypothetical protein
MIFGLERSGNKIYDRIILELVEGLNASGHHCVVVQSSNIKSVAELYNLYARCDWVIVTNNSCLMSQKIGGAFLFEQIPARVIFLHHDALSHVSNEYPEILEKVEALVRIKDRSIHFTIEKGDQVALNGLGVTCYSISHMNTLGKPYLEKHSQNVSEAVSFIGHAIPPVNAILSFGQNDHQYFSSYRARLANFEHSLREDFASTLPDTDTALDAAALSSRIQYLQLSNYYTLFLRGGVLQELKDCHINLYGGDPAWMHGVDESRAFSAVHITNRKPVFDGNEVANIFHASAINLNITSLQFDSAMINRVIDCVASGGFILTDRKSQLFELTSCADAIGYSTIDELNEKIDFYLDPANLEKKREIVALMSDEFAQRCSVAKTVERILEKVSV